MQTIERTILAALLRDMRADGYLPVAVWDGGEYQLAGGATCERDNVPEQGEPMTDEEVAAAVNSVDVSTLHFTHRNARTWGNRGVMLVLGNGQDIISDSHAVDGEPFNAIMESLWDRLERGQLA